MSPADTDKAMLAKKMQWEIYDRPRHLHGDGEDRVKVDLEDNLALEGDHEKYTTESREILFQLQILTVRLSKAHSPRISRCNLDYCQKTSCSAILYLT